jgi:GT2 family glycosyltransferase
LESAGGFDEAFNPVEYEDLDLCYRIRSHGFSNLYLPDVEMYHFESVTTAGTPALPNTALIIRHSLEFKKRWSYMFENEKGPDETEAQWERIPIPPFETIGELPLV